MVDRIKLTGTTSSDVIDLSLEGQAYEVYGRKGNDTIRGTTLDDVIVGEEGHDDLFGGDGNDLFLIFGASAGEDLFDGGTGYDVVRGDAVDNVIRMRRLSVAQSIEEIDGGAGYNTLAGTGSNNTLDFSATRLINIDLIDGDKGNDVITGSAFDDRIKGGRGHDTLIGGGGLDTAVFSGQISDYQVTINGNRVTVKDLVGGEGTDQLTDFAYLQFSNGVIDLTGSATPPNGVADEATVTEDQSVVIDVLANDSDPGGRPLDVTAVAQPSHGSVVINADNTISYTPDANFSGTDSFTYTVSSGPVSTATATVTLTVQPTPDAPVAQNDQISTSRNTPVVINVLGNDKDPDGDPLSVASFSQPAHGTVTLNLDGTLTYTPEAGFSGADSFTYAATDQTSDSGATVSVQVVPALDGLSFRENLTAIPENTWVRLNLNHFQDVWTPRDNRADGGNRIPDAVVGAWSSMAWDSKRGDLIFWGGGHANYPGNEVYRWHSATLEWERASLPSEVVEVANSRFEAVDGYMNAPTSSHTYDNSEYLPIVDRFMILGGAAFNTGSALVRTDNTLTGPYFWDPSKGDADKVGGTTGSQANPDEFPDVVGGEMWENRDNLGVSGFKGNLVNGTTAYAEENGKDVIYFGRTDLWKFTVNDINDPSKDTFQKVGRYFEAFTGDGAGAIDTDLNVYLRTTKYKFVMWDLNHAGPDNKNVGFVPDDPSGLFNFDRLADYGMDYDPKRGVFVLWKGDGEVWTLNPPDQVATTGWTLTPLHPGFANEVPDTNTVGVFGKWKYVVEQDIFIGVNDSRAGDVWVYKPHDWQPANSLPELTVAEDSGVPRHAGDHVQLTDLIDWSDVNGDTLSFGFVDLNGATGSGYFELNGVVQQAGEQVTVTAQQLELADLVWVVGNEDDDITVKVSDPFGSAPVATLHMPGDAAAAAMTLASLTNSALGNEDLPA